MKGSIMISGEITEDGEGQCHRYWFALQTHSRHERIVRDWLIGDGFEPLLPTTRRLSQWTDRKKWIEEPLFAGYCFARFSLQERTAVRLAPGVVRIVGTISFPEPIPDEEIEAIKKLTKSGLTYNSHPFLVEGTPVQMIRGPLAGVKGKLLRNAGHNHIVIQIQLIQQAVAVHVNADDVVSIEDLQV
jgi:transcription antitermination factor NusG